MDRENDIIETMLFDGEHWYPVRIDTKKDEWQLGRGWANLRESKNYEQDKYYDSCYGFHLTLEEVVQREKHWTTKKIIVKRYRDYDYERNELLDLPQIASLPGATEMLRWKSETKLHKIMCALCCNLGFSCTAQRYATGEGLLEDSGIRFIISFYSIERKGPEVTKNIIYLSVDP